MDGGFFAYETKVAVHLQRGGGEVRQSGCLGGQRSRVRSVEGKEGEG